MFSKMLLLISFLFNFFNLTFSFENELIEMLAGVHQLSEEYGARICSISVNLWAGLCEDSILYLRSSMREYSNLYVSYTLFKNWEGKCDSVTVQYPNSALGTAAVLHCYGRPSVIQNDVLVNLEKIAIVPVIHLPSTENPISKTIIFKQAGNTKIYLYLAEHELGNPRLVHEKVLGHQPPLRRLTYTSNEIIPSFIKNKIPDCFNEDNVLQRIGLDEFIKVCVWMFGQERFQNEFIVSSNRSDYGTEQRHWKSNVYITASDWNGIILTEVYPCSGQITGPAASEIGDVEYALALTERDDWVILCKTMYVPDMTYAQFYALEVVSNLDAFYLTNVP